MIRYTQHSIYEPTRLNKKNKLCDELDIMMDKYGDVGTPRYGLAGAYNVALAKIVPRIKFSREYLRLYFFQPAIIGLLSSSAQASTRGSLNSGTFDGLDIVLPDEKTMRLFEELHLVFLKKAMLNNRRIQTISALRDTLLPKLMKGEVRVKGFND